MSSTKRLRSVVHSIAHHAMSGLCDVHPHLGHVRKPLGVQRIAVDLLHPIIEPAPDSPQREIELCTNALRGRFSELLAAESLNTEGLASAIATFFYKGGCTWTEACLVQVETTAGIKLEDAVGQDGRRARILRDNTLLHATREMIASPEVVYES